MAGKTENVGFTAQRSEYTQVRGSVYVHQWVFMRAPQSLGLQCSLPCSCGEAVAQNPCAEASSAAELLVSVSPSIIMGPTSETLAFLSVK